MRVDDQAQLLKLQSVRLSLTISLLTLTSMLFANIAILLFPDLMHMLFLAFKKIFASINQEQIQLFWPNIVNAVQYLLAFSVINLVILVPLALTPTSSHIKDFSLFLIVISSLAIVCFKLSSDCFLIVFAETHPPIQINSWPLFIIIPCYIIGVVTAVSIIIYTLYRNIYHSPMSVITSHIEAYLVFVSESYFSKQKLITN